MTDPDDIVEVPRWAVTVASQYIEEQHAEDGEVLGVLGGAYSQLRKAAESGGRKDKLLGKKT